MDQVPPIIDLVDSIFINYFRERKKPYGITLITCNSTLVYIIDYLRGPVSGNFDVKIDVIEIVIIDGDCY